MGGAKTTRAHRPWNIAFYVSGLTHKEALQLEWAMKHKRAAGYSGLKGRIATLRKLMNVECRWTRHSPPMRMIKHRIRLHNVE